MSTIFSVTGPDDTKALILAHVGKTPGIRYRELLRLTDLTNGTLEYHLKILERTYKITICRRDGRRARYYPIDIPADESHILEYIRNKVARQIVLFILENDLCTFSEILRNIKKAPSTLSWHLKRLCESGIVSVNHGHEVQLYKVVNGKLLSDVVYKYRESFRDKVTDGYYEVFNQL
jgi:predicted transcriptional regulator